MAPHKQDGTLLHDRKPSVTCRVNGVMVLMYRDDEIQRILLTVRSSSLKIHRGEISFPGGGVNVNETPIEAAVRETEEETGLSSNNIEVIGGLSDIYIPISDNLLKPFIGIYHGVPRFRPSNDEVALLLTPSLSYFLNENNSLKEKWHLNGYDLIVPCWRIDTHPLWGASAMIMSECIQILKSNSKLLKTLS